MDKLTVGELRKFIEDMPDSTEVRIASLYNTINERSYHVSTSDITGDISVNGSLLILETSEIEILDDAGL